MDGATLRSMAADPMVLQQEVIIPSAHGPRRFGEVMAPFQGERFASINPALVAVARGEKPATGRHWWEATKGASKDSDLAVCLLWLLAFTGRPLLCQVGAADRDQAGELKKACKDILRLNPWLSQRVSVENWRVVCEATESVCEIIAADVAGSHGARPDVLVANELSHVTKQEFCENLFDNASKVPRGLAIVATNAGFLGTWQYQWRELARESERWHFHRTAEPSPWLDEAEIEEARRRNSNSRFLRLWHAVWASGSGDALDFDDVAACCTLDGPQEKFVESYAPYIGSVDLGLRRDHSALIVLGFDPTYERIRLVHCESWDPSDYGGEIPLDLVERACHRAARTYELRGIILDPWQAELMMQRLVAVHGVPAWPYPPTGRNLDLMAKSVLQVFRNRQIAMYRDIMLIDDLSRLSIVEKSYGYKLEAVRDDTGHADRAMALAQVLPIALELLGALVYAPPPTQELTEVLIQGRR